MRALGSSMRPFAGVLIAALALSAAPARGADDVGATARPATLAGSATTIVARMNTVPAAALQQGSAPASTGSGEGFLGTTKGKVAVALLVAGVVITVISRNKDAVHSPAR